MSWMMDVDVYWTAPWEVVTTNALILLDDLFLIIAAFASSKIGPLFEFSKQTTPFSIGSLNLCFTPTRHPLQSSGKDVNEI